MASLYLKSVNKIFTLYLTEFSAIFEVMFHYVHCPPWLSQCSPHFPVSVDLLFSFSFKGQDTGPILFSFYSVFLGSLILYPRLQLPSTYKLFINVNAQLRSPLSFKIQLPTRHLYLEISMPPEIQYV